MANVRIGADGSIIKDDQVIENSGGTVIREDGTIETTNHTAGNSAAPRRPMMVPPVSPLENGNNSNLSNSGYYENQSNNRGTANAKIIAEKEYDIQVQEARIRGAFPKTAIIATCILCVLGIMGLYIMFIPAITRCTGCP